MVKRLIQNRYRILGRLGKGGMGSVYKAEDTENDGKIIALKRIGLGDGGVEKLPHLRHEFKTLVELHHPNLGEVFDFGEIPDRKEWFFTSEYIEGEDFLEAARRLSWDELLEAVVQICHALEYIHSRDITHHDVKPRNILIRKERGDQPWVKVLDFGLSVQGAAPEAGQIRGTVHYLAPEVIRGDAADGRADLYSLGATLYHVVTGRPPFVGDTSISVIRQHLHDPLVPPKQLRPDVPAPLANLLIQLLAKSPADRLQSANQVIREINKTASKEFPLEPEEATGALLKGCFVGRTREMGILSEVLRSRMAEKRVEPQTSLVIVEGQPSVGKSRLVREFQVQCQVDGIPFLHGSSYEEGEKTLGPLVEVISQLVPILESIEPHRAKDREGGPILKRYAADLRRVVPELPGKEATVPAEDGEEKLMFMERLSRFFIEALEGTPAVIYLSGLHRANEATLEFLEHLAAAAIDQQFLIVVSYRPEEIGNEASAEILRRLAEREFVKVIRLGGIDRSGVALLLRSMLGTREIPGGLIDYLHQGTGGNPFFLEEGMKQLVETGVLRYAGGRWTLSEGEGASLAVPGKIREMIVKRIENVSLAQRDLLEVLATLERPATPEYLASIGAMHPDELPADLHALERKGFLTHDTLEGGPRFSFTHPLVREITYECLDRRRRKEIHDRIAERLIGKDTRAGNLEALSHHLMMGTNPARALPFLIAVGDRSRWLHADEAAIRYYQEALRIVDRDDPVTSLQLLEALAAAHKRVGRFDPALELQGRMILTAHQLKDRLAVGRGHVGMAEILRAKGDHREAEGHADKALSTLREIDETEEVARALSVLGSIHWKAGDADKARGAFEECLEACRSIGHSIGEAAALSHLGRIHRTRGEYDQALDCHRKSLRLRESAGSTAGTASSLSDIGRILWARGEYEKALESYRRSLELRRELGDPLGVAASLDRIGPVHGARGEYALALEACAESLKIRARIGDRRGIASALAHIAQIHLSVSDIPMATHFQGEALGAAREIGDRRLEAAILCEAGMLRILTGNKDEAGDFLHQAREMAKAMGEREMESLASVGLSRVELSEGKVREAYKGGTRIIEAGAKIQSPKVAALGRLVRGDAAVRLGKRDAAMEDFEEAVKISGEIGDREILWQASHAAGRLAVDGGDLEGAARRYHQAASALAAVSERLSFDSQEAYLSDDRKRRFREDALRLRDLLAGTGL